MNATLANRYSAGVFIARALSGLPAYGPRALSFPTPDAFREGFVVEFVTNDQGAWVGNFERTWSGWPDAIHAELGPEFVLIVAGGAGYIIDAEARCLVRELSPDIQYVWFERELDAFVVSNGLWFEMFDRDRLLWRSRRFSWDGLRNVERQGLAVTGEAYDPTSADDAWLPFTLNLENGEVHGGSYNGPPM